MICTAQCQAEANSVSFLFKGQKNADGPKLYKRVERDRQEATFDHYFKDNIQNKEVLIENDYKRKSSWIQPPFPYWRYWSVMLRILCCQSFREAFQLYVIVQWLPKITQGTYMFCTFVTAEFNYIYFLWQDCAEESEFCIVKINSLSWLWKKVWKMWSQCKIPACVWGDLECVTCPTRQTG